MKGKMDRCEEDWRTCGHCKVRHEFPEGDVPTCDKAGFWRRVLGLDVCRKAEEEGGR